MKLTNQFRLMLLASTLSLVTMMGLCGCGTNDEPTKPADLTQEQAIAEIKELGGSVSFGLGAENKKIYGVVFNKKPITDGALALVKGFTTLELLNVADTKVTDAGLVHLKALENLQFLSLESTQVTDAGLVHLKGLTNLMNLNLVGTPVTDDGLVNLKAMVKLKMLSLEGTQVTDAGLKQIRQALPDCIVVAR